MVLDPDRIMDCYGLMIAHEGIHLLCIMYILCSTIKLASPHYRQGVVWSRLGRWREPEVDVEY